MRSRLIALMIVCCLVAPAVALGAASPTRIAEKLRCVTCGTSLDVSDAPSARQMKDRIAREVAAGKSEQEIIDGFVRDFGRQVLATPPKSGFDLWVGWAIPIGVPLLALLILPLIVRSLIRRRRADTAGGAAEDLDDEDRALVDRALRESGDG